MSAATVQITDLIAAIIDSFEDDLFCFKQNLPFIFLQFWQVKCTSLIIGIGKTTVFAL